MSTHPVTVPLVPVLLAGGSAAALWPLSRGGYPKQLLRLTREGASEASLLEETARRAAALDGEVVGLHGGGTGVVRVLEPIVVCHEDHRYLVRSQLAAAGFEQARLLLEPAPRGTASALLGALVLCRSEEEREEEGVGSDPLVLVLPADHLIQPLRPGWMEALRAASTIALAGGLAALGVEPRAPASELGYLRLGPPLEGGVSSPDAPRDRNAGTGQAWRIEGFVEKPDPELARSLLAGVEGSARGAARGGSGQARRSLWNTGIYLARAGTWEHALRALDAGLDTAVREAMQGAAPDGQFLRPDAGAYRALPRVTLDSLLVEGIGAEGQERIWGGAPEDAGSPGSAPSVRGPSAVLLTSEWWDVGAWSSLNLMPGDDSRGNLVRGDVVAVDCQESTLISTHRLVTAVGISGLVVVETPDAVMVVPKEHCRRVEELVGHLRAAGRPEPDAPLRVYRPWGDYESLDNGARYQVKRLTVQPGEVLSLQMHYHRAEHWVVVRGTARVTRGDEVFLLTENQSTYIPIGTRHRLENPGTVPLEIIEIQSGTYLGEDDIVRFEDRYDRAPGSEETGEPSPPGGGGSTS